jgi:hypothetical protein
MPLRFPLFPSPCFCACPLRLSGRARAPEGDESHAVPFSHIRYSLRMHRIVAEADALCLLRDEDVEG